MLLPQLHPVLQLLLAPVWAATLTHGDFSLALPDSFEITEDPALLEGQWAGGRHAPSGGGFGIRSLDAAPYLDVNRRLEGRIDVDAALSADRFALLALQEVQGNEGLRMLYVGPADGVAPQVGRWIFTAPAESGGRLVWWHIYWRTPSAFVELAAWAPIDRLPQLQEDLRRVEAAGNTGSAPADALLFESGQQGCGPPARVDRATAIRDSRRFQDAREVLRESHRLARDSQVSEVSPTAGLRLAEHRALGVLYRHTETCVHEVARAQRVCSVLEGQARGATSLALQASVVACLDADQTLTEDLKRAVEAAWASP